MHKCMRAGGRSVGGRLSNARARSRAPGGTRGCRRTRPRAICTLRSSSRTPSASPSSFTMRRSSRYREHRLQCLITPPGTRLPPYLLLALPVFHASCSSGTPMRPPLAWFTGGRRLCLLLHRRHVHEPLRREAAALGRARHQLAGRRGCGASRDPRAARLRALPQRRVHREKGLCADGARAGERRVPHPSSHPSSRAHCPHVHVPHITHTPHTSHTSPHSPHVPHVPHVPCVPRGASAGE